MSSSTIFPFTFNEAEISVTDILKYGNKYTKTICMVTKYLTFIYFLIWENLPFKNAHPGDVTKTPTPCVIPILPPLSNLHSSSLTLCIPKGNVRWAIFLCGEIFMYASGAAPQRFYTYTQDCDGQTACYTIRGFSLERSTKDWELNLKRLTVKQEGLFLLQLQMRRK